jgi:hypothetical protein
MCIESLTVSSNLQFQGMCNYQRICLKSISTTKMGITCIQVKLLFCCFKIVGNSWHKITNLVIKKSCNGIFNGSHQCCEHYCLKNLMSVFPVWVEGFMFNSGFQKSLCGRKQIKLVLFIYCIEKFVYCIGVCPSSCNSSTASLLQGWITKSPVAIYGCSDFCGHVVNMKVVTIQFGEIFGINICAL